MVDSLFRTTGPLNFERDRAIYVERPEADEILRQAARPTVDSYLALLGSRQTGKTTVLYRVYDQLKRAGEAVAFLDLAACRPAAQRADSAAQSYAHTAFKIWEELIHLLPAPNKLRAVAAQVDGPIRFREFLLDLARQCRSARIVVLLDEVGAFMSNLGFFETIRSVSSGSGHETEQSLKKYLFVFSGSIDLHELTTSQNSPLANMCRPIYLQDFDRAGVEFLVHRLADLAPVHSDVAAYVYEQTHGHPYLTQRVCALVEPPGSPAPISVVDVKRAIERLLEDDENLRYLILQLERYPAAREVMRQICEQNVQLPFSLLNPQVARLWVIGAIRRQVQREGGESAWRERVCCAVRNPIYERCLLGHLTGGGALPEAGQPGRVVSSGDDAPPFPAAGPRDYLDFHVRIYPSPTRGEPFPVTVDSWAGSGSGQVLLDVRSPALRALIERLETGCPAADDLGTLGGMLWQSLFASPDIERRYLACQTEAGQRKGIRLKLTIESPDLMNLPWEYLYDPDGQTFPALSPRTPITRYTHPRQQEPPPLALRPPLRILVVSAEPVEQPRLDVQSESELVMQAMGRLQQEGRVEIERLEHATVRSLQAMLRRPFHVLHYIGHGIYHERITGGMLALEDEQGRQHAVSAAQLQYLLRDTTVRLAVFNACMTARGAAGRSIAAELMRAGLSATLAMQFAISEQSATIFAGEFYRTLADGWSVDAAVAEGRKAVMFATDLSAMDWGAAVLFMRARDGILFQFDTLE